MVLQDAAQYGTGTWQSLSPLLRLPHRAIQAQLPSDHSLFSKAAAKSLSFAPTASTDADSLPTASQSQAHSLGQSDSRGTHTGDVASTSHAGQSVGDGEGHSTDYLTRDTGGSNTVAANTVMGHGDAGSVDQTAATASAGSAAVGAHSAAGSEAEGLSTMLQPPSAQEHASPQERHVTQWQQLVRDPFALLMHLLALTQSPQESADPDRGASVSAALAAAGDRVTAFQASG